MKIKDILTKKIKEILRSKIKLISICTIFVILICVIFYSFKFTYAVPENSNYNLFFPDLAKRTIPNDLVVMVFLYDDYPEHDEYTDLVFNMNNEEIETKYNSEIFGSGNIEDQTWSINDYYKENSNGKFYFNPVLIGDNESGVYPIRFNKNYNESKISYDIKEGFEALVNKGLDVNGFDGLDVDSYGREKKDRHVLCVFPKLDSASVSRYKLTDNIATDVATIDYNDNLTTTAHELGHLLEMHDLYYQGGEATLMGEYTSYGSKVPDLRYPGANYVITPHIDPLHKIVFGWYDLEIIDKNSDVKLYPTTSTLYNPIIVPTEDNGQYYIIENRKAESFESQITDFYIDGDIEDPEDAGFSNYEGINVWRVDNIGYKTTQTNRKGDFVISVLNKSNNVFFPKKYSNVSESKYYLKENTNIKITFVKSNSDGSIDVNISFDEKYKNSYTVRYNANDGTENYIDKTYSYTENIESPVELFSRLDYEFIGWNTKLDGSGQWYFGDYLGYALIDEKDGIVNLYAQWKKEKNTITFNTNGGIGTMEAVELTENMINDGYILPEPQFTSPSTNHIFKGWYVPEYESVKQPGETVYLSGDNELVAQWGSDIPSNNCTINFNSNGGTNVDNQQITKGGLVIEPQIPVKEGYIFGGWYEDDTYITKFYFGKPIYSDLTLYAKWISNENIIKSIDIKMEIPTVGDKVTIEKEKYEDMEYWNWDSQKPQMKIIISDEEHYHLSDEGGAFNYMHWITKDSYDTILDPYDVEPFIGSFEYDTNYYARIFLETNDEYIFADDLIVTVNGSNKTKIIYVYEAFLGVALEITTPKEKEESGKYTILEGVNQNYLLDSEKDLIIKADGDISDFEGIKVDDVVVDEENYILTSGSTVLSLKHSYLNTLVKGTHKITFIYKHGEVSTTFTIGDSKTDNKDDDTIEEIVITTKPIENIEDKNNNLPTTGDGIIIWGLLFIIGLIGSIITYKKIRSKYEIN